MRRLIALILILTVSVICVQAQEMKTDSLYNEAFQEILEMLNGERPISLKRAVFVSENAYLDGTLDYKEFCRPIEKAAKFITTFIKVNKLERFKTAKQMAICEFMFHPWSGNDYTPFEYDNSEQYPGGDWHYQLVSRTFKTHFGQCHSLPWAMRLLAEEIGAEMHIALAPRHSFITYIDADNQFPEDWVNVEVTSHQYLPSFWIKEHFEIKDSAIVVGTYLAPLSDIQTIACQLGNLALSYVYKYGTYNEFTYKCATTSLQYFATNPTTVLVKSKSLESILLSYLNNNGWRRDCTTEAIYKLILNCHFALNDMHWTNVDSKLDKKLSNK